MSVAGVSVVSLLTPLPPSPDVVVAAPQTGTPAQSSETAIDSTGADADLVERAPTAPGGDTLQGDTLSALDGADTQPVAIPQIGEAGSLAEPAGGSEAAGVDVGSDAPVAPAVPGAAPTAPTAEAGLSISTEPAQPRLPEVAGTETGFGSEEATPSGSDTTGSETGLVEMSPEAEAESAPAPQIAALPQAGQEGSETGPGIGNSVVPLTGRDSGGTARLPSVGDAAEAEPIAPVAISGRPLDQYSVAFDVEEGKPMMAILLIDDAESLGAEALENFPYALTFAIDPTLPGSAERMAARRAAGFEVVALVDLPAGATAQDAEVALSASFEMLPETVALLEGTQSGFQGSRDLSNQVTAIVKGSGRGLITQDNGLNTAQKLAQRDGVPSGVVFRDFDGAGQSPTVMRRFLDQAAFRAGQERAVIMLGRVQPDTISALLLWGLQDRASRVALVPVSTVLNASVASE